MAKFSQHDMMTKRWVSWLKSSTIDFKWKSQLIINAKTLTLLLLVANLVNKTWWKKDECHEKIPQPWISTWWQKDGEWLKPWQMGTHQRVLSKSFPMNTNMTDDFNEFLLFCALGVSNLSIRRVLNPLTLRVSLETDVCYSHTFENNFGIKH